MIQRGMDDEAVIAKAFAENWILIPNDKDFGEKVYREQCPHKGVVLLRLEDERVESKIGALRQLLEGYAEQLPNQFVVVTEKQVRFVRMSE